MPSTLVLSRLYAAGSNRDRRTVVDHSKALAVSPGADQIAQIGMPPQSKAGQGAATQPLDLYREGNQQAFGPNSSPPTGTAKPEADEPLNRGAPEPAIDSIAAEKRALLARYRASASG